LQPLARQFRARGGGIGLAGLQHDLVVFLPKLIELGAIGFGLCRGLRQRDALLGHEQRVVVPAAAGVLQIVDRVAREDLLGQRVLPELGIGAELFELRRQPRHVGVFRCRVDGRNGGEAECQRADQRDGGDRMPHGYTPGSG
jgi:hypothetical protein